MSRREELKIGDGSKVEAMSGRDCIGYLAGKIRTRGGHVYRPIFQLTDLLDSIQEH
jgi:hypothetical protein